MPFLGQILAWVKNVPSIDSTRQDQSNGLCCEALRRLVSKRVSKLFDFLGKKMNNLSGCEPSKTQIIAQNSSIFVISGSLYIKIDERNEEFRKKCILGVTLICSLLTKKLIIYQGFELTLLQPFRSFWSISYCKLPI